MSYKLEKPYSDIQRANFVCEHQGLNYYEDDNCIIMYLDSESVTNGVVIDISQTAEYLAEQKAKARTGIVKEYSERFKELDRICGAKFSRGLCTTVQINAQRAALQSELTTKLSEV